MVLFPSPRTYFPRFLYFWLPQIPLKQIPLWVVSGILLATANSTTTNSSENNSLICSCADWNLKSSSFFFKKILNRRIHSYICRGSGSGASGHPAKWRAKPTQKKKYSGDARRRRSSPLRRSVLRPPATPGTGEWPRRPSSLSASVPLPSTLKFLVSYYQQDWPVHCSGSLFLSHYPDFSFQKTWNHHWILL